MTAADELRQAAQTLRERAARGAAMSNTWDEIQIEIERSAPSSLAAHLDRDRPYDGQPHTDHGERGKTFVTGLTMRDVIDCYVRACYDASGLSPEDWPSDLYGLPWDDMDPVAVGQNLTCWVERYMGIYPNVRKGGGVMTAIADASLIDGPARTIVLVIGGVARAAFALAWLLCRAAAIADRVEPGCDEQAWLDYERSDRRYGEMAWLDHCERCDGRHVFTRQAGVWRCLLCDEPQVWDDASLDRLHRAVWQDEASYDHEAVEALYADLDAWNRRAS